MYKKSKELAYIIGVYLGDGSTTIKLDRKRGNKYRFQLGSIDKEFVDYMQKCCKLYNLHSTKHISQISRRNPKWNDMYFMTISNKEFVLYLRKETKNKTIIPGWIFNEKYEIEFVNGILDSEGFVGKVKQPYGYKYSVGINTTDNWIYKFIDILKKHKVVVNKEYQKILPSKKIAHWFQFNIVSFINSPFQFRIKRKKQRLQDYNNDRIVRDSLYWSKIGLKGAKARWNK